jgi:hypothetical protein
MRNEENDLWKKDIDYCSFDMKKMFKCEIRMKCYQSVKISRIGQECIQVKMIEC